MTSSLKSYTIEIHKSEYSYGFDFKDEGCPYKKFAIISKASKDNTERYGLRVGDKVIAMNDEQIAGKDYVLLRNSLRKSLNNCVKLEILNNRDSSSFTPEPNLPTQKNLPWEITKRILVPIGSIREKIGFFQNDGKRILSNKTLLRQSRSNSCGCLIEAANNSSVKCKFNPDQINSTSLSSIIDSMQNDNVLKYDLNNEVFKPISQEPFSDDSIRAPCGIIQVTDPCNFDRVLHHKSNEHIKKHSIISSEPVLESNPEPFENNTLLSSAVPKIEISNFQSSPSFSMSAISSKMMPVFPENLSRSSNNIFEDVSTGWQGTLKSHDDFLSMTDINSEHKEVTSHRKKIIKQQSVLERIPIKLRIIQFKEKVRSKSWKDYILEATENGARFRKRLKSLRHDKTNNFVINASDVKGFEIDSPHKRIKNATGNEIISTDFSITKYDLITSDNHVHLKFYFNPSIFQDAESSSQAHATYKEIIGVFMQNVKKNLTINNNHCLSEPFSNLHLSRSHDNFVTLKELKSPNEDSFNFEMGISNSNSFKSTSKSSIENTTNNTPIELIPSPQKNIIKQALEKIRPEKKLKSYEVFTGTKAEFEEFKKQLESGILPPELDSSDETGTNFNRFIHEVPRMMHNLKIPMIIYLCTKIIEHIGLQNEGIYRISGNQRVIRTLCTNLNKNPSEIDSTLSEWNNVHAVCGILKLFLRKLKQNLIPADLSHVLAYSCKAVDCDDPRSLSKTLMDIRYHLSSYQNSYSRKNECKSDKTIKDQLDCRWQTLQYLLKHLAKVVSFRRYNNMDEHALSICFNPVVMESWQKNISDIKADNEIMIKALELILVHQDWLFVDWNPNIDGIRNTELMNNAYEYALKYIAKKDDISIKTDVNNDVPIKNIDINTLVYKIVNQATMDFGDKKRLQRRHSSHMPDQKGILPADELDDRENTFTPFSSKFTDALDLFTTYNSRILSDKVPNIDDNKRIKVTFISSTESLNECDETVSSTVTLRDSISHKRHINCDIFSTEFNRQDSEEFLNHLAKQFY